MRFCGGGTDSSAPPPSLCALTNTGPTAVVISSVTIPKVAATDSQEFFAHYLCPASLAPGKSCTITVGFNAYVEDYSPSASLIMTDSAVGSPQTIPLSATVINPHLQTNPTSLSFPPQKVGTTSTFKRVTLMNSGTTPMDFTALTITGNFTFNAGASCNNTTPVAPGKSCELSVVFKPSSTGNKSGNHQHHGQCLHLRPGCHPLRYRGLKADETMGGPFKPSFGLSGVSLLFRYMPGRSPSRD